uniref:Uncharacterized protein n=1 Tax=Aegilops tauschii TaxID=37682 RepID=M8BS65_AEGTA
MEMGETGDPDGSTCRQPAASWGRATSRTPRRSSGRGTGSPTRRRARRRRTTTTWTASRSWSAACGATA